MPSIDYDAWASTYDSKRRACHSVTSALLGALGPAGGRRLLDIGAGTGNFAKEFGIAGFSVALCDISSRMLRAASRKLPFAPMAVANAEFLPFRSASFDCAVCINVLPHVPDRAAALAEARRILGSGPLVVRTTTSESERSHWAHTYFPTLSSHQPNPRSESALVGEFREAGFPRVDLARFWYQGDSDGSFQSLKYEPEELLDAAASRRLAVFKRLPKSELEAGSVSLGRDLQSGRLMEVVAAHRSQLDRYGDGVIVAAANAPLVGNRE